MADGDVSFGGTTTSFHPLVLDHSGHGFGYAVSTNFGASTQPMDTGICIGGVKTTGGDLVRIPIHAKGELAIDLEYQQITGNYYPAILVKKPPKSENPFNGYTTSKHYQSGGLIYNASSTKEAGWRLIVSSAAIGAAGTSFASHAIFHVDTLPYSHFKATSQDDIDINQLYVEFSPVLSTVAGLKGFSTHLASIACSTINANAIQVRAIEYR